MVTHIKLAGYTCFDRFYIYSNFHGQILQNRKLGYNIVRQTDKQTPLGGSNSVLLPPVSLQSSFVLAPPPVWMQESSIFNWIYEKYFHYQDINECNNAGACPLANTICINEEPYYSCQCRDGYYLSDNGNRCIGNCLTFHLLYWNMMLRFLNNCPWMD